MNWKQFKSLFKKETVDETRFILGIDLGNDTSVMSYYDMHSGTAEVVDISGGYGKPSVPTVMQYVSETKEWVFGEYAVLNKGFGKDVTLTALVDRLGKKEYIDIDAKSVSIVSVLGLYLKELIGNIKNINPKANIVGIVASIPSYLGEEAKDELLQAFMAAGYEKELIGLYTDRTCMFSRYYFENKPTREKIMVLDFGSRELRGSLYDTVATEGGVDMVCMSSLFDQNIGTKAINNTVSDLFSHYYCRQMGLNVDTLGIQAKGQIEAFVYQHKDLLFHKNPSLKPIRLYFNFAYPPFQQNITKNEVDFMIQPLAEKFKRFVERVLEKNAYAGVETITPNDIDRVICVGGGFEMVWAKKCVQDIFPDSHVVIYKNAKATISEGAAVLAAGLLGVIDGLDIVIEDKNQVPVDIGVKVLTDRKEKFLPIVEKNAFWWQDHRPKMLLLNEKTDKPIAIEIFKRDEQGDVLLIQNIVLDDLPIRPRGTTKIKLQMQFKRYDALTVVAKDCGFGELFPSEDYERTFTIDTL